MEQPLENNKWLCLQNWTTAVATTADAAAALRRDGGTPYKVCNLETLRGVYANLPGEYLQTTDRIHTVIHHVKQFSCTIFTEYMHSSVCLLAGVS